MTAPVLPVDHAVRLQVVQMVEELGAKLVQWRADAKMREFVNKEEHKLAADYAAHEFLRQDLGRLTGDIPIVSEEDADHASARPELYWLLDPIDGTASWLGGFAGFVTQLALMADGKPIFSVICAPVLGKVFVAQAGFEASLNREPLRRSQAARSIVVTDNTPKPHGISAEVMRSLGTTAYRESGSLGLKMCLVADGTADLFVKDVVVRDWDIAPAMALLDAVGGVVTCLDGAPFLFSGAYDKHGGLLVARDRTVWRQAGVALARITGREFRA